jgi:hypothetical protein
MPTTTVGVAVTGDAVNAPFPPETEKATCVAYLCRSPHDADAACRHSLLYGDDILMRTVYFWL